MKKVLYLFVAAVAIYFIYTNIGTWTSGLSTSESEADSLRKVITKLKADQALYDDQLNHLNDSVERLQTIIYNRDNRISQLKKLNDEKVTNVPSFTTSDIYKFLSARYKDSTVVK